jgi:hypothetical protein
LYKLQDWGNYLSPGYTEPFFVYFTWRYDYEMQKRENELVLWWEQPNEQGVAPVGQIRLLVHQLNNLDLPPGLPLQLDYLPSLLYIDQHKQLELHQGITNHTRIQQLFASKLTAA